MSRDKYGVNLLPVPFLVLLLLPSLECTMLQITKLDVKCGRSGMTVQLEFDRRFDGVVYSKGHFYDPSCNYITSENSGSSQFMFTIPIEGCGTDGQLSPATKDEDMYFENTIIVQNDPLIQEEWDVARRLRCVWQHTIQKSVSATPLKLFEPQRVTISIDDRSVTTLMEIHRGKTPFSSHATGYVYAGEDASIVIYVQEPSGKLDASVASCTAVSPAGDVVPLVDEKGCVTKPELMTEFTKTREVTGVIADLMLYSYLKGFQIGDSNEFTISCSLEICRGKCSSPCQKTLNTRSRRQANDSWTVDTDASPPSAVIDVQRGVVVITKEKVQGYTGCGLDRTIMVCITGLFGVVVALSILTCCLAGRIRALQQQIIYKKPVI